MEDLLLHSLTFFMKWLEDHRLRAFESNLAAQRLAAIKGAHDAGVVLGALNLGTDDKLTLLVVRGELLKKCRIALRHLSHTTSMSLIIVTHCTFAKIQLHRRLLTRLVSEHHIDHGLQYLGLVDELVLIEHHQVLWILVEEWA